MSNPTIVITGASRGLGRALARALAAQGWQLILTARGAEALEAVRQELAPRTRVAALAGDVADPAHRQAIAEAGAAFGGVDALVNNASTLGASPLPTLVALPLDVYEATLRTNVVAPLALIQALAPHLRPGARILNLSSDAARGAYETWGGYGSSKAALDQLSNVLGAERPDWKVYAVDPGDMNTQMHQDAFPGEDISDRPAPEASVPGLVALLAGTLPSGRYAARALPLAAQEV